MILAHKIQIDPTQEQASYFARACGTSRFVWNWALEEWNRQYRLGEKPSGMKLKKQFNAIKYEQYPRLEGNSSLWTAHKTCSCRGRAD